MLFLLLFVPIFVWVCARDVFPVLSISCDPACQASHFVFFFLQNATLWHALHMHGCCRQREWNTQKLIKKWHQCDTYRWWLSKQHILLISFAPHVFMCMCIFSNSFSFHFTMSEDDAWCVATDTKSNASAYIYNVNRLWHPNSKKN